jgi:TolB-like protein/Tfp pilus assembly protein PilF/predicted Ser/Thr protein kinase
MMPERWQQVERLYHDAAELSQDRRSAFLDESCGEDENLRREVESLLAQEKGAQDFLERPALEAAGKDMPPLGNSVRTTDDALGWIGETLSHYRIVEKLGGGGMGVVYKAADSRLGRFVALKFLPDKAPSDGLAIERFKREARAASALNHPHICTVHDIGEHDGRHFIVMELLEGKTLKYHVAGRSLEVGEIARLGVQIAEALEAAHAKGIVHRDIKPANIFVTPRDRVKVLDFGLAKLLQPGNAQTTVEDSLQTRGPVGTLPYMAPEQVLGRAVDERADIYGLGMVLYEMAAGKRPFREDLASHLTDDILHKVPAPPSRLRPGISSQLDEIILKCLEKDTAKRFQSAQEVRTRLEEFVTASSGSRGASAGRDQRFRWGWVAIFGGLVVAGAIFALANGGWRKRLWPGSNIPRIESLAVLPLANLTGDAQQDFFVDGVTEELTTDLAQIAALRVTSRTSATQAKNSKRTLPELARVLNVDAVVEGSVTRVGNRVRVTAQLIEAKTDRHLWAKSYEKDSQDVLALQDQLARDIASEIRVTLTPAEHTRLAAVHTIDPRAYDDYLRGRYFWNRRTEADLHKAKDYFQSAIANDPAYAPAYSGLADTYFYLGYAWGHLPPTEAIPLSQAAALKAIELDESGAEGHASLGTTRLAYDWDFRSAEQELRRAIALNPNYAHAHHIYSIMLGILSRNDEALAEIRKAADLDPLSVPVRNILAERLVLNGRCEQAFAEDQKTIELNPTAVHVGYVHDRKAECYRQEGKDKEAFEEEMASRSAKGAGAEEIAGYRRLYAKSGRKGYLQQQLQVSLAQWNKDHWHNDAVDLARIYSDMGDLDNAYAWVDKSIAVRSTSLFWILGIHGPFREDPRFEEMKRKMGARF